MAAAVALVRADAQTSPLGLASPLDQVIAGRTVLAHTLCRLDRIPLIERIILVHPPDQDLSPLWRELPLNKPLETFASPPSEDRFRLRRRVARLWAPTTWRGGLGGAVCYDELLPAADLLAALDAASAESALLVGGDWMLLDPRFCQEVLATHLEMPQSLPLIFTQAPPGLAGIAVTRKLLDNLTRTDSTFGYSMAYKPTRPQADPIGRDVCVQIPGAVRSLPFRFIPDTPAGRALIHLLAESLADRLPHADAATLAHTLAAVPPSRLRLLAPLPQLVTLELTPRRQVTGPVTPQHYVAFDRPDLSLDLARRIIGQIAQVPGTVLLLGGLGDALEHPHWDQIVTFAKDVGVGSLGIQTDLLCSPETVDRILELPIDLVSVRLNADTAATYQKVMGADRFAQVIANLERLINTRNQRTRQSTSPADRPGLPWIIPHLVKTADTLADMESFFDKWMYYLGHAVIESPTTGCGLMPDLALVDMSPPARQGVCRQLTRRMSILSDGSVALCDQDWLGRQSPGSAADQPLTELWARLNQILDLQAAGRWNELALCSHCREWHRP